MSGAVRERSTPEIPTVVLGAVLLAVGVAWLLDATDAADISWRVVLPGVLIVIGIGLVAGAVTGGRHGGLLPAGIALTIFLTVLWVLPEDLGGTLSGGVGERTEAPQALTSQRAGYRLGVGQLNVDLRGLDLEQGDTDPGTGGHRAARRASAPGRCRTCPRSDRNRQRQGADVRGLRSGCRP